MRSRRPRSTPSCIRPGAPLAERDRHREQVRLCGGKERDSPARLDHSFAQVGQHCSDTPGFGPEEGMPVLASADVAVAAPGHDRTYVSFGERLGASVATALGIPLIKVATQREFRPPAKDLPGTGNDAIRDEFSIASDLSGATAVIIDDVFRTGGTMSAVGSAAVKAGATRACGLVAVRTMRR
jgi:phosphoribosylpyrophosphate synthetase